jgi:hypothetical protein
VAFGALGITLVAARAINGFLSHLRQRRLRRRVHDAQRRGD